jgi:hypothetical protein
MTDCHRHGDGRKRVEIGPKAEPLRHLCSQHGLPGNWLFLEVFSCDDVNADGAAVTHQIANDGSMEKLEPAGPRGLADDDLRDVAGLRVGENVISNTPVPPGDCDWLAAKRLCKPQRVGDAVAIRFGELQASPRLDIERRP